MKKAMNGLLGLLLAFVMVVGLMPTVAHAAGDGVAKVGDQEFDSLTAAIEEAGKTGGTVTLLKDVTEQEIYQISVPITLDLGGKVFTSNATNFAIWVCSDVTIQNGTIKAMDASAAIYDSISLTIGHNVVIESPNIGIVVKEKAPDTDPAKLTIAADGTLDCPVGDEVTAILLDKNGNQLDVYGSVTSNATALQSYGIRSGITINIYEGADVTGGTMGIYFPSDGEVNISGGKVTGGITGIEMRAGSLTMTGGTVKGNANGAYDTVEVQPNGSGSTTAGADIAVAKHTTKHDLTVTISGGELAGTTSIYESKPQGDKTGAGAIEVSITDGEVKGEVVSEDCTEFISGGVFAKNPDAYVAPDANFVKDSKNWVVGDKATEIVENAEEGDTLSIYQYDGEVNTPEGVQIENETGEELTVNGNPVTAGETITTDHELEAIAAKDPTCTTDGNIAYWHCTICDKYYSDEEGTTEIALADTVLPKKHGETEIKNAVPASCTAEGYTGDEVCKQCGATVKAGKTIAKTAHTYKDGKCTVCGKEAANVPATGDNSNVTLYVVLMLVAGAGLLAAASRRKAIR